MDILTSSAFLGQLHTLLQKESPLENGSYSRMVLQEETLDKLEVQHCTFSSCTFSCCSLAGASFTDVQFQNCDLSNSLLTDAYFARCRFISCRCIGTNLNGSVMRRCTIEQSTFQYADFDHTKMTDTVLTDTDFTEAAISEAKCKRLSLHGCRFVKNYFFKTPLAGIDFSTGTFCSPVVSWPPTELKGATVSLTQAAALAGLLGVKVNL